MEKTALNKQSAGLDLVDWDQLLVAYLHDPVDKALDIRGHEARAARYASRALDRDVTRKEIKSSASLADSLAAIAERVPMPTAGRNGERAVGPEDGRLDACHPVSAGRNTLEGLIVAEEQVLETIGSIVDDLPCARSRFLALWRLLPERLAKCLGHAFVRLPADTRIPDHTLTQHADITSGLWASRQGAHGGALLSLSLSPVQSFIEAARSVRDLWTGSATLSWLVFQGLRPVLETLGPTALVYPALRGNPLMDLWLRDQPGLDDRVPEPSIQARRSPSIPNRFVAVVPGGPEGATVQDMADKCAGAVRAAWRRLAEDVRRCLVAHRLYAIHPEWDRHWDAQIKSFFEVRTATLPLRDMKDECLARLIANTASFDEVWQEAGKVRRLADAIPENERPRYDQRSAGRWQAQLEVSARLMEAQRSIRHVPTVRQTTPEENAPAKCSLFGSYEQMGPANLNDSRNFWKEATAKVKVDGVRLRKSERFSAVALCKRFAAPATFTRELHLKPADLRFPDTATVAAAEWLAKEKLEVDQIRRRHGSWSGRWLHQKRRDDVEEGDPPPPEQVWERIEAARKKQKPSTYYAILVMDADHMGFWLKGDYAPRVCEVLHPKMVDYYERLGVKAKAGLDAKRPVGPALHAAISEALNNFASHIAPGIVEEHKGTLIYSGGDDVLALLPARQAVKCAAELYRAFRGEDGDPPGWTERDNRQLLMMGSNATLSAGIAFVHYMEDLRLALDAARRAEQAAKDSGRNRLMLRFMRRSGEHSEAGLSWKLASWFQQLVASFTAGSTDRWTYRLRQELPTLRAVSCDAVTAEIRRLVNRSTDATASDSNALSGQDVEDWWRRYAQDNPGVRAKLLESFILLCQGAAFVARGHDG